MIVAQPLLDFLTGSARAALPFLRSQVLQGISANQIISNLKDYGLSFQRQRVLDVIAALRGYADLPKYLRLVGGNTPLPYEAHVINIASQQANYNYVLKNENAPEGIPEYITVSSVVPLSVNNILALGRQKIFDQSRYQANAADLDKVTQTITEASASSRTPPF